MLTRYGLHDKKRMMKSKNGNANETTLLREVL